MTAHVIDREDPLLDAADPCGRGPAAHRGVGPDARARSGGSGSSSSCTSSTSPSRPDARAGSEVLDLVAGLPALPAHSRVTLEPGGQIELSTPPGADVVAAVSALRADRAVLRESLLARGYGAAPLGTDPARPVSRINPGARYAAMERHFDALGCAAPGMEMMTATAALQLNLDAGPATGWEQRLGLVRALVPVLVACSSTSPYLSSQASGWHSMRQGIWRGIDHGRSDPIQPGEPTLAWADYALDAPVMLVREDSGAGPGQRLTPVTRRVSFAEWLRGAGPVERRPGTDDLDYHLTTLFPPVRPRGYLEIRCLDALPDRWWPGIAALVDDARRRPPGRRRGHGAVRSGRRLLARGRARRPGRSRRTPGRGRVRRARRSLRPRARWPTRSRC